MAAPGEGVPPAIKSHRVTRQMTFAKHFDPSQKVESFREQMSDVDCGSAGMIKYAHRSMLEHVEVQCTMRALSAVVQ